LHEQARNPTGTAKALLDAAYPIIERAVRARMEVEMGERLRAWGNADRADERRRIVEALRAEGAKGEASMWTFGIAADFIERELS